MWCLESASPPRSAAPPAGTGDGRSYAGRYPPVRSRCLHPGQQQGRRWPSSSSSCVRRMRRARVISCLASSTQQMNSLRAKGVMSFQASSAVMLAINAARRSAGNLWTTPPGTRWLRTGPWKRAVCEPAWPSTCGLVLRDWVPHRDCAAPPRRTGNERPAAALPIRSAEGAASG